MAPTTSDQKRPPIWEVISFPTSDAYLQDPSIFKPVVDFISQHNPYAMYTGLQIEEPSNRMTGFCGWDSVEQHITFTKEPTYAELGPLIVPCIAGEAEVKHVSFRGNGEELLALRAPVTELAWMTPKEGISPDEFQEAVKHGTELFHNDERCLGAAWGMVVEPEEFKDMAVYVAGWNSKEERDEVVKVLFKQMESRSEGVSAADGKQAKSYDDISNLVLVHLKLQSGGGRT